MFNFIDNYSFKVENWMNQQLLPQLRQILQQMTTGNFWRSFVCKKYFNRSDYFDLPDGNQKRLIFQRERCLSMLIFDTERANSIIKACRYTNRVFMGFISGKNY